MQALYDAMKQHQRDDALESAKKTAISSGEWGTAYGALDSLLYGQRSVPKILLRGLGTGLAAGGIGGASSLLGDKLLGPANSDDPSAYTKEGAVGGTLGGGLLGAGTGYLLGAGKLSGLAHLPGAASLGKAANAALPLDNLVVDWIKKKMLHPSSSSGLAVAAGLGLLGAGIGGMHGTEAGMDRDTMAHLEDEDDRESLSGQAG